jgi:hypothetical protein
MSAIIETFQLEVFPLGTKDKLEIEGSYNYFPIHPLQDFFTETRSDESIAIHFIKLNGVDITSFMNHIVFEWNDENYYEALETMALDHCRNLYRGTNELDTYTEQMQ